MKNYLVIGASSGIGAQIAQQLIERGDQVYGTYFQTEPENDTRIVFQQFDATQADAKLELPDALDGFFYCPGSINLKPFARVKPEELHSDLNLMVTGAFRTLQLALPALKKGSNPSVTFFSSVAVQTGFPFHSIVSAAKGAIEGLTKALAAELAPTIRVNAIAPSLTATKLSQSFLNSEAKLKANEERHPLKRIGSVKDIADGAIYAADANWVTGQILTVDGGIGTLKI